MVRRRIRTPKARSLSPARLLGAIAGAPAGSRRTRRGTVLIIVIGALALLSVITIAYVTVGKGDRRTAHVVRRDADVDEVVDRFVDYVTRDVIGADIFSIYKSAPQNVQESGFVREGWDYPSTPWLAVSDDPALGGGPGIPNDAVGFTAAGTIPASVDPTNINDLDDLASFPGSDPWLASTEPTWINYDLDAPTDPDRPYLDTRDWLHISNIAPDGRFVNLYNLRGNFDALHGRPQPADVAPRLGEGLTLFDDQGRSYNAIFGSYPSTSSTRYDDQPARLNFPAHWDSGQKFAFRPARDIANGPDVPEYLPYQWADADGDGFFDSRWQALVDASDPDNPISIIPNSTQFRWFFATRIVDLSAYLNVNTATNILRTPGRPDRNYAIGASPADVDLYRLLFGIDTYEQLGDGFTVDLEIPESFETVDGQPSVMSFYRDDLDATKAGTDARYAYSAIWRSIEENDVPDVDDPAQIVNPNAKTRFNHYRKYGGYFEDVGLSVPPFGGQESYGLAGYFGIDDQFELMTRHGANDDTQVSRLEQAAGGRSPDPAERWYSPLRDNWPTTLELGFIDNQNANGALGEGDGFADPDALLKYQWDPRHRLTVVSGARSLRTEPIRRNPNLIQNPPVEYEDFVRESMLGLDRGVPDLPVDAFGALLLASGDNGALPQPAALYRSYARALAPYLAELEPNDWQTPVGSPLATTAYGDDPTFALLAAAHRTANAVDAFDEDRAGQHQATRGPSAFTVALSADTEILNAPTMKYPWPLLDLGRAELAPSRNDLPVFDTLGAVNVFGIEAQPFVTEVASMLLYADTPNSNGGDKDWADPPPPGSPPGFEAEPEPITINGATDSTNADYVMQALIFQLHNPFDEDVNLTSLDAGDGVSVGSDQFLYYIEYAGNHYKLVDREITTGLGDGGNASGLTSVVLEPGETRTFFILSEDFDEIVARWNKHATVSSEAVKDWIEDQISIRIDDDGDGNADTTEPPIYIEAFEPTTGASLDPPANFFGGVGINDGAEVRLWRRMTSTLETQANDTQNDLLADRMHKDDMKDVLDRSFSGNQEIGGTLGLDEGLPNPGDNTGYTILLWGSVRRPNDPAATEPPLGAIPAFCIERRQGKGTSLNVTDTDGISSGSLHKSDFVGDENNGFEEFDDFVTGAGGLGGGGGQNDDVIIDSVTTEPKRKTGDSIDTIAGGSKLGIPYTRLYPQIHINNEEWTADPDNNANSGDEILRLRLGDMLLPLAVGPTFNPDDPQITGPDTSPGWITLSEVLCSSLGYDGGFGGGAGAYVHPYDDLHTRTDRANLLLDAYVPFDDANGDGVFDPMNEVRREPAVPLALNVLSAFRVIDPRFGSIVKPTYGAININTAPLAVLRCLPMLSPPIGFDPVLGQSLWWWDPANAQIHDYRSDIASTILAYRDKIAVWPRDVDNPNPNNALNFAENTVDDQGTAADTLTTEDPTDGLSREARTGIVGVRETPGFATIGEVMNARDFAFNPGLGGGGNAMYLAPHDIDRLGVDEAGGAIHQFTIDEPGVESTLFELDDDGIRDDGDEIDNDYDQKLAIANGLFNTISVRSDIYAVWFVVHGYQRSDVEGLRPEEPLVPSVARRYLMIVDRSNVTELGDKPRILAIKQLPL